MASVSLNSARQGAYTNKLENVCTCRNRFPLICVHHGEEISVPCGRWRSCRGCGIRKQWEIRDRFIAGIEQAPAGMHPMFFTLTFPEDQAPSEDDAHAAWRSLVARLRYRGYLDGYGWVLQRQRNGTLHFHGIAHMAWFTDALAEWRALIQASGFGIQNQLVLAQVSHARYCARYISARLARLAPLRRAFGFSRGFPLTHREQQRRQLNDLLDQLGAVPECAWLPLSEVLAALR